MNATQLSFLLCAGDVVLSKLLKWHYDQKIISFFSSDFESMFA